MVPYGFLEINDEGDEGCAQILHSHSHYSFTLILGDLGSTRGERGAPETGGGGGGETAGGEEEESGRGAETAGGEE